MLINLRNSGAAKIQFFKYIDSELLYKIVSTDSNNVFATDLFLKDESLDSFVLDKSIIKINSLHLVEEYSIYKISIDTNIGKYNLLYYSDIKPDFFKTLFKYLYPDIADKQVEELI